jgi:hypothetical protein
MAIQSIKKSEISDTAIVTLDNGRIIQISLDGNSPFQKQIDEWISQGNTIEEISTARKVAIAKLDKKEKIKNHAQSLIDDLESDIEVSLRSARMDYYLIQSIGGGNIPQQQFDKDAAIVNTIVNIYQIAKQGIQEVNALTTIEEVKAYDVSALNWPSVS